jgi:hypothetical protein
MSVRFTRALVVFFSLVLAALWQVVAQPLDITQGPDSDADGFPDAVEVLACSDPNAAATMPEYDLAATIRTQGDQAILAWAPPDCAPVGYLVWERTDAWRLLDVTRADQPTYTIPLVTAEERYKVTWFVAPTPEGGFAVTQPERLAGWQESRYAQVAPAAQAPAPAAPAGPAATSDWALGAGIVAVLALAALLVAFRLTPPKKGVGDDVELVDFIERK